MIEVFSQLSHLISFPSLISDITDVRILNLMKSSFCQHSFPLTFPFFITIIFFPKHLFFSSCKFFSHKIFSPKFFSQRINFSGSTFENFDEIFFIISKNISLCTTKVFLENSKIPKKIVFAKKIFQK